MTGQFENFKMGHNNMNDLLILMQELGHGDVKNQGCIHESKHGIRGNIVWTNYIWRNRVGFDETNGSSGPTCVGWIPDAHRVQVLARTLKWGWMLECTNWRLMEAISIWPRLSGSSELLWSGELLEGLNKIEA